jgi:hypothetical protein
MAKQSKAQQETVRRVMHEFKHGELETHGRKVESPKQAIAIALHEAGASNQESPEESRKNLRRAKAKERGGAAGGKAGRSGGDGRSRAELYAEAKRRGIPGRSKMSKDELARAARVRRTAPAPP